jgi:hypothetical protein
MHSAFYSSYPEEHVPHLVDHFLVADRLASGKALGAGQHKVRGILEMESGVNSVEILGRLDMLIAVSALLWGI